MLFFDQAIEYDIDQELLSDIQYSAKTPYVIGAASGKIDMRGDILATLCVKNIWLADSYKNNDV